ncbi:toll/interleukin-1 receptor domain-containing protein [Pseudomonas sp. SED1]|uniref:toll/interleukin-1 receptor domain-containing protein n=1 Tax=Pseudomonas sp. SED1 TaxID=3056845 RepID=UPI00296FDDF2|nr:TIR domain-containing protein [Pseudomonas sp. SED1]MDY0832470.1 TIR domain-containing protein [Pseudomonas sp. SED1]
MTNGLTALNGQTFAVGLSFAGEQRAYVQDVALSLREKGVTVFYDGFHEVDLWGCDLVDTLNELYSESMNLVVVFISKDYVAKDFTNVERRAALSKAITSRQKYVMPVRFDDTKIPGIPNTFGYLSASENSPEQLAVKICKALGISERVKANEISPPYSKSAQGTITFNHTDHDGRFLIGEDEWQFEIATSGASNDGIYIYNDPPSINGVAIAEGYLAIAEVQDAKALNYTSRTRRPKEGQVAVLLNNQGFYAALKIVDVKALDFKDDIDSITIEYVILRRGGCDFSVELIA